MVSAAEKMQVPDLAPIERIVGNFEGDPNGPTLIVVGSIHGNEPSGRLALERVAEFLEPLETRLKGRVYLLTGNVRAACKGVRFINSDLNRFWTRENVRRNTRLGDECDLSSEDLDQQELLAIFRDILRSANGEVYVLDLHSTSAEGHPFATVGDTMRNRRFAMSFPVTILLGIEEQLDGTLLEFLNNEGAVTLGFEAGQHAAVSSVDNHEALIFCGLKNAGILSREDLPEYAEFVRRLEAATGKRGIFEVRHREPVTPEDEFVMVPGFNNFEPVAKGQVLAENRFGAITATESGMILMPLYQKLGEDGFFIVKRVAPFWLRISAFLRWLDTARFVKFLPGVRQHPKRPEQLQINTQIARFFPLQIFHLLGFRRIRWKRNFLLVSRRRFDTQSPFGKERE